MYLFIIQYLFGGCLPASSNNLSLLVQASRQREKFTFRQTVCPHTGSLQCSPLFTTPRSVIQQLNERLQKKRKEKERLPTCPCSNNDSIQLVLCVFLACDVQISITSRWM